MFNANSQCFSLRQRIYGQRSVARLPSCVTRQINRFARNQNINRNNIN
jgi:hypothetical protein